MLLCCSCLFMMNKEILLGDKNHRKLIGGRAAAAAEQKEEWFMKSINEFDALLSNRSTSANKTANKRDLPYPFPSNAVC